ncbi:MAG: hypothetical protein HQL44_05200 [Alphaproteobacteria bacterium]|nr:hypothetical protein [Alphaproteobacteria bacterium]
MYFLYYAGMASNWTTEQIGLALSDDGEVFHRYGADGMIIPIDPASDWKNLRVCNPHVLPVGNGYAMLYQGIAAANEASCIGLATSSDGFAWNCHAAPVLRGTQVQEIDSGLMHGSMASVIEPCVLEVENGYRLWFVYRHKSASGNAIYHARSTDLVRWRVDPTPVLTGAAFPFGSIWYPQVVREGSGFTMYVTVRSDSHAIYSLSSQDGLEFRDPFLITGEMWDTPRAAMSLKKSVAARRLAVRALGSYQRMKQMILPRLGLERGVQGLAHAHLLPEVEGNRLYVHAYNLTAAGRRYMEIGQLSQTDKGQWVNYRTSLSRSPNQNAWDSAFVADPFVISSNDPVPAIA